MSHKIKHKLLMHKIQHFAEECSISNIIKMLQDESTVKEIDINKEDAEYLLDKLVTLLPKVRILHELASKEHEQYKLNEEVKKDEI